MHGPFNFIVISSSSISLTIERTMSNLISLICALMLLVVDVSGKKYIVETEDYQDLSSKKEDTMSRGYPKIKRNVCIIFLLRLWNELD